MTFRLAEVNETPPECEALTVSPVSNMYTGESEGELTVPIFSEFRTYQEERDGTPANYYNTKNKVIWTIRSHIYNSRLRQKAELFNLWQQESQTPQKR